MVGKAKFQQVTRGLAKLTPKKVAEARRLRRKGYSMRSLCERYAMSRTAMYMAVSGRTWPDVQEEPVRDPPPARPATTKLTERKVLEARQLRARGWTFSRLAMRYGLTKMGIRAAVVGDTWQHLEQGK
jgi:lambda repressor-like predicted transcriptional regulator